MDHLLLAEFTSQNTQTGSILYENPYILAAKIMIIMASNSLLPFLFLGCFLLPLSFACPESFHCGQLGEIHFPFTDANHPECGLMPIWGCNDSDSDAPQQVELGSGRWFGIGHIDQKDHRNEILIQDLELELLVSQDCSPFDYIFPIPPLFPLFSVRIVQNITLLKCKHGLNIQGSAPYSKNTSCPHYDIYFDPIRPDNQLPSSFNRCSNIQLPPKPQSPDPAFKVNLPFIFLTAEILIDIELSKPCLQCLYKGGQCLPDETCMTHEHMGRYTKGLLTGVAIGSVGVITIGLIIILLRNKRRYKSSGWQNQSRNIEIHTYSNTNPASGNVYFGVPVFSYEELEEATNNFDRSRELGRGGFGTVYHGKLKDGREVAVKRLFERSYKRVEQFMNEINILTRLRHRNLVLLFGCTSRHSRELLLVYEYIPNGTLGCHLHGNLAKPGSLPWPLRMRIAIETASALSYLHACDIIHRDVKTSNILLDNQFCVKVADFGLSRLFPNFVTHVSTAPAGTPGYLDPEYNQCYHLTDKSDVYSFGVVLIELISSMPPIDITRSTDEIKLANLAIKRIQRREFVGLVDPSLGFESDDEVKRMIVSVAKLAFQCLQRDKELRPSMDEVFKLLQKIEFGKDDLEHLEIHCAGISERQMHTSLPTTLYGDGVGSLKNLEPQRLEQTL